MFNLYVLSFLIASSAIAQESDVWQMDQLPEDKVEAVQEDTNLEQLEGAESQAAPVINQEDSAVDAIEGAQLEVLKATPVAVTEKVDAKQDKVEVAESTTLRTPPLPAGQMDKALKTYKRSRENVTGSAPLFTP